MPRKRKEGTRWQRESGTATERITFRFSPEELARLKAAGSECGPTVTEWGRQVLLEALERHEATRVKR